MPMSDDEVAQLLLEWMARRGGVATEDDFEDIIAILEEHFEGPHTASLKEARRVLGLTL